MAKQQDDRRRHRRYPVELEAQARLGSRGWQVASIRDICLGGALLEGGGAPGQGLGKVSPGTPLELQFQLPGEAVPAGVWVRVVRLVDGALGVMFEDPPRAFLESLKNFLTHSVGAALPYGEEEGRLAPLDRERVAAILQRLTGQRGGELFDEWLQAMEDAAWQQTEREVAGADREALSDETARIGHLRLADAGKQLFQLLEDSVALAQRPTPTAAEDGGLELVDDDSFETWLEGSALAKYLEDDLHEPLRVLRSQVLDAFGSDDTFVLQPRRLVDAFAAWADRHGLSGRMQRIGIQAGRAMLPRLLGAYYRDLSRALEEAGCKPRDFEMLRDKVAEAIARAQSQIQARRAAHPAPTDKASAGHAAGHQPTLPTAQVVELLLALPPDALRQATGAPTGRALEERALALLGRLQPDAGQLALAPPLRERIAATDRLLGHALGNAAASPRMQQWLDQLGLRLLTAAVADPHFFRRPWHPLLQLVGRLEQAASLLPADSAADTGGLGQDVARLIDQALQLDPRQPASYAPLMTRLDELEQRHSERFRQEAARLIAELEGRERRRRARRYVHNELVRRFAGRRLHRVMIEVIDNAWLTLLELHYLRGGANGAELGQAWDTLAQLAELCGDGSPASLAGTGELTAMETALRDGFAYVGFDPFHARAMLDRIHECARRRLAGLEDEEAFCRYQPAAPQDEAEALPADVPSEAVAALLEQLDGLRPGALLRARGEQGERLLRLVWRSPDGVEFVFLDGPDGQAARYARGELLRGLYDGRLRLQPAQTQGLVDRVLNATLGEMQEHVRYHESRDALTGLYSAPQFTGRLAELLKPGAAGEPWLLGFLCVDRFEVLSASCGYQAGEQLLRSVAEQLRVGLADDAVLAFLGGDRFGVLLPAAGKAGQDRCERVRRAVAGLAFQCRGRPYLLTASLGLVPLQPGTGEDPDRLLSSATIACAAARESGGDRLVLFREEDAAIRRRQDVLQWMAAVEEVIRAGRIRLRVQQIAPVLPGDGCVQHHEVLMTPYDADGRALELSHFIGTAEAFDLMAQVDRLVIRTVLAWAGANPRQLAALGGLAINLSGCSLSDHGLLGYIREQLEASGVAPAAIGFEVTETAAIASMERAVAIIEGLRELGCRVALDDFGSGMSSYAYLKSLPVDYVKIDGAFVRDLPSSPHDLAIVRSINEIAHFMGIETIAEYVEQPAIAAQLAEIGIDYMQGYAVHRPAFLDELPAPAPEPAPVG